MHATHKTIASVSKSLKVAFIDAKLLLSPAFQVIQSYSVVFGSFQSIRSSLVIFGPHWSYSSIRAYPIHFGHLFYIGPFGLFWFYSINFCLLWLNLVYFGPFYSMQSTLVLFGPYSSLCFYSIHLSPFQSIMVLLGPFSLLQSTLIAFCSIQSILSTFVLFGLL